ncbi:hypothetical protein GGF46_004099 [Coemansia sp. RSA 552]|nr:hypothetical protein GGF46_004099 [Coemansia sp. RSA 552]
MEGRRRMEQAVFDELPPAYQIRIRDIEQELEDEDITPKGFDKRLAQIMNEYQATRSKRQQLSPRVQASAHAASPAPAAARVRNGSKKAFYDGRKSTVAGFKKPGINFEALLDEFSAADDDDDDSDVGSRRSGGTQGRPSQELSSNQAGSADRMSQFSLSFGSPLQPAPPVPELPSAARDARFDVEMSSGRAYNVLSDIMDPYGAQAARTYSDDSSGNSILEDIGGLGPSGFNPDIITQGAMPRPHDPWQPAAAAAAAAADDDDAASTTSSVEIKRMNSLMYPHRRHPPPPSSTMPRPADLRRQISRQNGSVAPMPYHENGAVVSPSPRQNDSALEPPGPGASLLTPDTPGDALGATGAATFGDEPLAALVSAKPAANVPTATFGLTPVSDTVEAGGGFDGGLQTDEMLAARSARNSLHDPANDPPEPAGGDSNRGSYSHWEEYTADVPPPASAAPTELEPQADKEPLYDDRLAADLEQSLSFSESFASSSQPQEAAGAVKRPENGNGVGGSPAPTTLPISSPPSVGQSASGSSSPQPASVHRTGNRPVRRPTYGARLGRRPTNAGQSGRTSYYAAEAELEVPANFDMQLPALEQSPVTVPAVSSGQQTQPSTAEPSPQEPAAAAGLPDLQSNNAHNGASLDLGITNAHHQPTSGPTGVDVHIPTEEIPPSELGLVSTMRSPEHDGVGYEQQSPREASNIGYGQPPPESNNIGYEQRPLEPSSTGYEQRPLEPSNTGYEQYPGAPGYTGAEQHPQAPPLNSIGAVLSPREIPAEAYSSRLEGLMSAHASLPSVLRYRATATPGEIAYTCVDEKGREAGSWTWAGVHVRATHIAQLLRQRGAATWGARVALVYRKREMLEFVGSLFGCFYAGTCAVPVVAGDSYAELVHVLSSTGALLVLTTDMNVRTLNKDLAQDSVGAEWPAAVPWVCTDNLGGCVLSPVGAQNPSSNFHARVAEPARAHVDAAIDAIKPADAAYVEFSKSPNGELKGVQITHGAIMRQCAAWMMSTGMLDVGRKYKHRVELDDDEPSSGPDYALGLDFADSPDSPTPTTPLPAPEPPRSPAASSSAVSSTDPDPDRLPRASLGKRWAGTSGFLGRLRNVGSLPKMRRSSRARDSSKPPAKSGAPAPRSTRNSLISVSFSGSGGRLRAASNLSTVSRDQPLPPASGQQGLGMLGSLAPPPAAPRKPSTNARTPSANVAVFKDVVAYYVEPRQHFGLVYGTLGGCYGGHQSIYASSSLCDAPGAYINMLTRYSVTVAVGDYTGLQSVLSAATDEPEEIADYSRKVAPNLARLRLCLLDTLFVDAGFHATFDKNVLHPFGCPYQSIAATEGHPVMTPVCTLAEHGSALMAMRDCLSNYPPANIDPTTLYGFEFVLDRQAFRENRILVLPGEKTEAEVDQVGTVRYPSFGFPALNSTVVVVDPETRELCAPDAIGELWIDSPALGSGFWGLPKLSSSIFAARFTYGTGDNVELVSGGSYLRTGLMGALVQGQVLVFGFYEDRIRTLTIDPTPDVPAWFTEPTLSFHYAGDINGTIRRYLPQVLECAAFEVYSNDTHFPVIAAEIRDKSGAHASIAEEIYGVLRHRHGLNAFAVALCAAKTLPRAFQYGKRTVNAQLCRHLFESGKISCTYVKITTDNLFMNLPPPAAALADDDVGVPEDPSVALYGRWLQQTSLETGIPSVDEPSGVDLTGFQSILDVLVWRASATPDQVAYSQFDGRGRPLKPLTYQKLLTRVSAVAQLMLDRRRAGPGGHVLVAIAPSPSFVVAIYACMAIGAIPIPIAPPDSTRLSDDMPPLLVTAREFRIGCILVDSQSEEVFRGKVMETAMRVPSLRALLGRHRMPSVLSVAKASKTPRHMLGHGSGLRFNPQWADPARPALIMQFAGAQASTPQYVSYSHRALLGFGAQQKGDFQMQPGRPVIASVRAYNGYGLLHCCVVGVYVGCTTLLLAPADFFSAPNVWFELVQRYGVKDAFTTLPMLQRAMDFLSAYVGQFRFNLASVRNFIVATEERVDPLLYANIRDFFARHGLDATAINPLYGTLMNPCVSTRAYLGVSPLALRLDIHAMRRSRAVALPPLSEADDPDEAAHHSLTLQDSGKVSGSTMVAIVDPATRRTLPAGCIGEVWVCSASNATQKQIPMPTMSGGEAGRLLMTVGESTGFLESTREYEFVRTGDLGFLYLQVAATAADNPASVPAEPYLFVAGRISETFGVDGYMYFYSDIERAVVEPCEDIGVVGCVILQTTLLSLPISAEAASQGAQNPTTETSRLRLVAVVSLRPEVCAALRLAPEKSPLPNAACLIFNNVLDRHQVLLDEITFASRDSLPRSRISERRRRTARGIYESGKLQPIASFAVSNSPTLPSGLQNPNSRHSLIGLPSQPLITP